MSILEGIKEKAMSLMGTASKVANRTTKVYDCSKNSIVVAGCVLDGVVSVTLPQQIKYVAEQGLDSTYYTYYNTIEPLTVNVEVLPTATCNDVLQLLSQIQTQMVGWFYIAIYENGDIVDSYRGHMINLPERLMSLEANNRNYIFGVKLVGAIDKVIDQTPIVTPVGINDAKILEQLEADTTPIPEK